MAYNGVAKQHQSTRIEKHPRSPFKSTQYPLNTRVGTISDPKSTFIEAFSLFVCFSSVNQFSVCDKEGSGKKILVSAFTLFASLFEKFQTLIEEMSGRR